MNKTSKKILVGISITMVVCLSLFIFWVFQNETFLQNTHIKMEIQIDKGDSPKKVYKTIFKELKTPVGFKLYILKIKDFGKNIKYGYYSSANMSVGTLLLNIEEGIESTVKITIPEGYNIYEIAAAMERLDINDKETIIEAAFNPNIILSVTGSNYQSLEGFLFPGTYFFPKNIDIEKMFKTMYAVFKKNLPLDFKEKVANMGFSEYEAIILASIVQKETYSQEEAPLVASVFLNRLKLNMRLQADPTIIYGMYRDFDGNIRKANIKDGTNVYNTYRHNGLPPTPICNPSLIAINAVINHAYTKYLYFVANNKGIHFFSETYDQHVNNVNRYIRK